LSISNLNWYLHIIVHCWHQQFKLSISLRPIVDIDNWYYCIHVLLISTIWIVDINNLRTLLISTKPMLDISNTWMQYYRLSISTIGISDMDNSNCWYQQCTKIPIVDKTNDQSQQYQLSISTNNVHYWYAQFKLLISTIGIK